MPPGVYVVKCIAQEEKKRGRNHFVVLLFSVVEPAKYRNVVLRQWLAISEMMSPHTKYIRSWQLASGIEGDPETDFSPEVFLEKVFEVWVGFRRNDANGDFSDRNCDERKSVDDFLRVHEILKIVDSTSDIAHKESDIAHCRNDGGGGGGEESTTTVTNTTTENNLVLTPRDKWDTGRYGTTEQTGQPTKGSPHCSEFHGRDIHPDVKERVILRTKTPETLGKIRLVKEIFPGARVVKEAPG
jgi:hypothetical protein